MPLESAFTDADGQDVRIGDAFDRAPVILVLGYFHCDKLCGVTRPALLRAARKAGLSAGSDYVFIAISIDPTETADAARQAREIEFDAASPIGASEGIHYLTGTAENIRAVAEAVGFSYRSGARSQSFVHPIGAAIITAHGVVSNYLSGIGSSHEEVRGAIEAAATQNVAPRASPALLLCFDFDSTTGRYTFAIMKFLRIGAVGMALALAAMIYREFRKGARA
ncbi:SCO family protein [Methylocystis sp. SC2]|uniref:SCO family protein n=1 Tax=Methylocystis sp. (strain SC2) TaxID=187303 RepID=UPI001FCBF20F|nr:SCO family protein [Methylocystis sp. SC2]